jgi:hypothetical protein
VAKILSEAILELCLIHLGHPNFDKKGFLQKSLSIAVNVSYVPMDIDAACSIKNDQKIFDRYRFIAMLNQRYQKEANFAAERQCILIRSLKMKTEFRRFRT